MLASQLKLSLSVSSPKNNGSVLLAVRSNTNQEGKPQSFPGCCQLASAGKVSEPEKYPTLHLYALIPPFIDLVRRELGEHVAKVVDKAADNGGLELIADQIITPLKGKGNARVVTFGITVDDPETFAKEIKHGKEIAAMRVVSAPASNASLERLVVPISPELHKVQGAPAHETVMFNDERIIALKELDRHSKT